MEAQGPQIRSNTLGLRSFIPPSPASLLVVRITLYNGHLSITISGHPARAWNNPGASPEALGTNPEPTRNQPGTSLEPIQHTTHPNDAGSMSECSDDTPKLLNCQPPHPPPHPLSSPSPTHPLVSPHLLPHPPRLPPLLCIISPPHPHRPCFWSQMQRLLPQTQLAKTC
jgi:hypothetical protein